MILFDLKCGKGHVFEAWFRDGTSAEKQLAGRKVSCPACGSAKVEKAPMAPRIGKGKRQSSAESQPAEQGGAESSAPAGAAGAPPAGALMTREMAQRAALLHKELSELRSKVEANCEYVGGRFAEEARKIHYGEKEARGIYGETSDHEASELTDEGIEFARIPWVPQHDS